MPWQLIKFIIIFALLLVFVFFNIDNKCDINFGFTKIHNAPVYLTVFTSFVAGMAAAFLSAFVFRRRGGNKQDGKDKMPADPNPPAKKQKYKKPGKNSETEGGGPADGDHGID